ncbi:MAG: 2-oxoacid:acceptor oxidoreductase family protein, partial [Geobacteraceae bacterium]|nr:2-oxoacid:acceptor oxidoreductase family protein [Geobacteraceae bacterium]
MKQQIIVSGIGGQGVLFLTRVIAQAAVNSGIAVLTSETHGMAQRGGTVLSCIKIGEFASPLIRTGQADLGFILWDANLEVHQSLMHPDGVLVVNSVIAGKDIRLDATSKARELGNAVLTNLILLGAAVNNQAIFCDTLQCEEAIRKLAPS